MKTNPAHVHDLSCWEKTNEPECYKFAIGQLYLENARQAEVISQMIAKVREAGGILDKAEALTQKRRVNIIQA